MYAIVNGKIIMPDKVLENKVLVFNKQIVEISDEVRRLIFPAVHTGKQAIETTAISLSYAAQSLFPNISRARSRSRLVVRRFLGKGLFPRTGDRPGHKYSMSRTHCGR